MSDGDDVTLDDLLTHDDMDDMADTIQDSVSDGVTDALQPLMDDLDDPGSDHDHDHDDIHDLIESDDFDAALEGKTKALMQHWADPEACSDESCERIREQFGIEVDADADDDASDDGDDDGDGDGEPDDGDTGLFGAPVG